jgi:putative addiction module component (TIGR02574 family)
MSTYADILEAAMALEPKEREELALTLFESTEVPGGESSPELTQAWMQEVLARSAAYKRGELKAVPWEEVRDEVRRKFGRHA